MVTGRYIKLAVSLAAVLLFSGAALRAQQVEFTAAAPQMVEAGVPFRVEFTANAEVDEFTPPAFSGVNIIAGPSTSFGQNISIVGGKATRSVTNTYTYILLIDRPGTVTIPEATVRVRNEEHRSRPVRIEAVSGGTAAAEASGGDPSVSSGTQQPGQSSSLAADDLLLRMIPNRTSVYKGEPIRVSFKIYTRVDLSSIHNIKYPAFNGFWSQEIPVAGQWMQETYNNKLYNAMVVREFLLLPQQSGTLSIDPLTMSAVAQIVTQSRRQSLMDDFFGGGPEILEIPKALSTGALQITVKDWPAGAPAGFNGAVGQFTMQGGPSQIEIGANSAANYDLKISGTGNLPLIQAPKVDMPASFEQYTLKTTDGYNVSGATFSGAKEFSIPFIARAEGEYTLSPVEFTYFDPQSESYKTLRTPDYALRIGRDTGEGGAPSSGLVSGVNKEELKILGEDIRFIRLGDPGLRPAGAVFLGSWGFWGVLLLLIAGFVLIAVYLQKRSRFRGNATLVRNKRAQKVALKRLKNAEKLMLAKDGPGFYEEMLKALWGYMSDKLNIPVAHLSRDNVREGLFARGVETEQIEKYVQTIADCEYARYAPSEKSQIGDVYNTAVELISRMESKI
jgi:hypothetical protein